MTRLAGARERAIQTGIPIIECDLDRKSISPGNFFAKVVQYRRILNREKPDIAFAVSLKPIVTLAFARLFGRRVPILNAFTGLGISFVGAAQTFRLRIIRFLLRVCFSLLLSQREVYCLFQNDEDRDLFVRNGWVSCKRSFTIPGAGVDLGLFKAKTWARSSPINFLFCGRLLWEKGIGFLVEASELLRARGLSFNVLVAGLMDQTNPSSVPLYYIEKHASSGAIRWLGARDDIPHLLNQVDCFVFQSVYREGVPKVLLEACAAGIPVITTNVVGCRDVVSHEFNGLLVRPRDTHALACAMERVIREREKLPVWGGNARTKAEQNYDVQEVIRKHIEILKQIAREQGLVYHSASPRVSS